MGVDARNTSGHDEIREHPLGVLVTWWALGSSPRVTRHKAESTKLRYILGCGKTPVIPTKVVWPDAAQSVNKSLRPARLLEIKRTGKSPILLVD